MYTKQSRLDSDRSARSINAPSARKPSHPGPSSSTILRTSTMLLRFLFPMPKRARKSDVDTCFDDRLPRTFQQPRCPSHHDHAVRSRNSPGQSCNMRRLYSWGMTKPTPKLHFHVQQARKGVAGRGEGGLHPLAATSSMRAPNRVILPASSPNPHRRHSGSQLRR